LRDSYAIPRGTIKDPQQLKALNAFFFWASWAYATNRPGSDILFCHNSEHTRLQILANVMFRHE
jgi:nitric oxide reductase subunit B